MRRIESIKDGQANIGNRVRVKIVKNKVAPPFREAEVEIFFGEGISKESSMIDAAVNLNIIEKSGSWFSYGGERIGQGKDSVKAYLKENSKTFASIEEKVKQHAGLSDKPAEVKPAAAAAQAAPAKETKEAKEVKKAK